MSYLRPWDFPQMLQTAEVKKIFGVWVCRSICWDLLLCKATPIPLRSHPPLIPTMSKSLISNSSVFQYKINELFACGNNASAKHQNGVWVMFEWQTSYHIKLIGGARTPAAIMITLHGSTPNTAHDLHFSPMVPIVKCSMLKPVWQKVCLFSQLQNHTAGRKWPSNMDILSNYIERGFTCTRPHAKWIANIKSSARLQCTKLRSKQQAQTTYLSKKALKVRLSNQQRKQRCQCSSHKLPAKHSSVQQLSLPYYAAWALSQ